MLIKHDKSLVIYFGNAADQLQPPYYLNLPQQPILQLAPFDELKKTMHLKQLFFLHQTHGTQGTVVDAKSEQLLVPFKTDGDFLLTALKHGGIGVMTADCLPLVIFDRVHRAVAVIHAGWRGAVAGIIIHALEAMAQAYKTQPSDCDVFFGPCAKVCCYQVGPEFKDHLAGFGHQQELLVEKNNALYFNLPRMAQLQLQAAGVYEDAMDFTQNLCTIENHSFYSARRQNAGRQMTVAALIF